MEAKVMSCCCFSPPLHLEADHLKPRTIQIPNPKLRPQLSRLRISTHRGRIRVDGCLNAFGPDSNTSSSKEAFLDLKLPRRNLMVQFTCNACGQRTQRTINRVAYEKGTVFVQCAGCSVNHKLVDNLGLVVEYDLRKDPDAESVTE